MLTLKELKKVVKVAGMTKRVPSEKALEKEEIVVKEILSGECDITVYANGYVLYRENGKKTIFPLHSCKDYQYMDVKEDRSIMNEEFFDNENWYIRLLMEATDRMEINQTISSAITDLSTTLESMEIGELVILALETLIVSFCMKIMSVLITVILYVRMIEIYLYTSVAPIPFATMSNREWGQIGTNYFRGLFALAFQAFLMMVCVAIYAVLVAGIQFSDNLSSSLFGVMAYTVILCFSLFKTGSLSKSIFNAH